MDILKLSLLSAIASIFLLSGICFGEGLNGHVSGRCEEDTAQQDSPDTFSKLHESLDVLEKKLGELKEEFDSLSKELKSIPESEEFKRLEKELDHLKEDLKKGGKTAREKIEKELIPHIKEEIERLKERYLKPKQKPKARTIEI